MKIEETTRRHLEITGQRRHLDIVKKRLAEHGFDTHYYSPVPKGKFILRASREISPMGEVSQAFLIWPGH
jgi:hypothetical protein